MEVSAGVLEEEGGAGALNEEGHGMADHPMPEGRDGRPHTQCLPRIMTCKRPGWCDFSPEKGQGCPEALLDSMAGPLNVHFKL